MNLIKFKDVIKVNDTLFNTYLKGKYAYWIHCRYVIPMDFITMEQYTRFEADANNFLNLPNTGTKKFYWDLFEDASLNEYIDMEGTDAVMNPVKWIRYNSFVADSDITLDELKKFRQWLAVTLLSFDRSPEGRNLFQAYDKDFVHVLEYYENNLFDDTVSWLSKFGNSQAMVAGVQMTPTCGCTTNKGPEISLTTCDPLYIYRQNIYLAMVQKFGEVDFWADQSMIFLEEFRQYIDNIIRVGLPLSKASFISVFQDCACSEGSLQSSGLDILKRLSQSLTYIIEDDIQGHRNYMSKAFEEWARQLYEVMYWM